MVRTSKRAGDKRSRMGVFERETRALDCFKTVTITHQKNKKWLSPLSHRRCEHVFAVGIGPNRRRTNVAPSIYVGLAFLHAQLPINREMVDRLEQIWKALHPSATAPEAEETGCETGVSGAGDGDTFPGPALPPGARGGSSLSQGRRTEELTRSATTLTTGHHRPLVG